MIPDAGLSLFGQSLTPSGANTASVAIFLFLMVGQIIACVCTFTYFAHVFLAVVEQTAAGNDEIHLPSEPFIDWVGRGIVLGYLLALAAVPAGFVLRMAKLPFLPVASMRVTIGVMAAIWLLSPIFILCSLSAASRWSFLHAGMLGRLARCPRSVLVFYVVSGAMLAACGYVWYLAFAQSQYLLWIAAAVLLASTVLIYGRLLGRLAWVAGQLDPLRSKKGGKKMERRPAKGVRASDPWGEPQTGSKPSAPKTSPAKAKTLKASPAKPPSSKTKKPEQIQTKKPSAPPPEEDEWAGGSYGLAGDDRAPLNEQEPRTSPDINTDTVPMQPMQEDDETDRREAKREALPRGSAIDEAFLRPREEQPIPPFPLVSGVYTFPWYGSNLSAWATLIFLFTVVGVIFQVMLSFSPV